LQRGRRRVAFLQGFGGVATGNCFKITITIDFLFQQAWYWGNISTKKSEQLLTDHPPGTFLVRDSRSDNYFFSISYQTESGVFHSHVSLHGGRYCFGGPKSFIQSKSLVTLVEKAIKSSKEQNHYHVSPVCVNLKKY
jgi:hypothetical protein